MPKLFLRGPSVVTGQSSSHGGAGIALGLGITSACDLSCAHCYRDPTSADALSLAQVRQACESIEVRSVNLGTGESGLHPQFRAILALLWERDIPVSVTSNGLSLSMLPDAELARFREVELSIDFPARKEQDAWRGSGNWDRALEQIDRTRRLGIEASIVAVMMRPNHDRLAPIAHLAARHGANLRVNLYLPVRDPSLAVSYGELWMGLSRLLSETELVATTEPVLGAVLGRPCSSGCGAGALRVTPRGEVLPCVYWPGPPRPLEDIAACAVEPAPLSPPVACADCAFVSTCRGGCASRRMLVGRPSEPDPYCPFARGEAFALPLHAAAPKELLKASSACTTIVWGNPDLG